VMHQMRMLVSHSTRDTRVRALWRFVDELQIALDQAAVPIRLVNVVSECGSMQVPDLPGELADATVSTDLTMMVLTQGYVDSHWCDDEMHNRARMACRMWSRKIEGWGVNLQDLMTDALLDAVEAHLWEPNVRPDQWREAIQTSVAALSRFHAEIQSTCTTAQCPAMVSPSVSIPQRLD
jgi:hypothetical protein